MKKRILITCGSGFIGTVLIEHLINTTSYNLINVDRLTYCSNTIYHQLFLKNKKYQFYQEDEHFLFFVMMMSKIEAIIS